MRGTESEMARLIIYTVTAKEIQNRQLLSCSDISMELSMRDTDVNHIHVYHVYQSAYFI